MWVDTDRMDEKGRRIRYLGYGGDHDELPNDGPFCANGLLDVQRTPSGKLNEAKHVQQPLVVTTDDAARGTAELWNRYEFTYADELLEGVWELAADGRVVDRGTLAVPHLAPRAKGPITLPKPSVAIDPTKEYFYRVSFRQKKDQLWAKRGFEQAWNQLLYGQAPALNITVRGTIPVAITGGADGDGASSLPVVTESDAFVQVSSRTVMAVFSRATGTLAKLTLNGKRIVEDRSGIVHGPRLQVERAFTDSDNWMRLPFIKAGLTQLRFHPYDLRVEKGESVKVTCPVRITGAKSGGFEYVAVWTFRADGTIRVDHELVPFGDVPTLPRIGTFMRLDGALENLAYYGRGPWENMVDRSTGCDIAEWRSTVTDQFVAYIRPQDCGGKTDVRWAEFTDPKDGRGVRFTAIDRPFHLQALHFTHCDLDSSRQRPGEEMVARFHRLVPREEVCLSLDCRQMGVGCNNCGPIPLSQYRFPVERMTWSWFMTPVGER